MGGVQRHGYGGTPALRYRYRVAGCVLLAVHLLVVGWLALRPLTAPWVTAAHLEPLATIRADLALGPWEAARTIGGAGCCRSHRWACCCRGRAGASRSRRWAR
ncbi:hypothetical protein GCM10020000_30650 [Streptomyces olivoverticillatus]